MNELIICAVIFLTGLYGTAVKKHLIRKVIGLVVMEYAVCLMIVLMGGTDRNSQTLITGVLAAGIALTVMLTSAAVRLYARFGTLDTGRIRNLKG